MKLHLPPTFPFAAAAMLAMTVAACSPTPTPDDAAKPPPWVRSVLPRVAGPGALVLSGTVRARHEVALAFQIGGRIIGRHADAGQTVGAGQLLLRLDPRDLAAGVDAAEAEAAAAASALALATADRERAGNLLARGFLSRQAIERTLLLEREAKTRVEAAESRLALARNAAAYGELRAPAAGIITELGGEPGQVVAAGQPVATLARAGGREIEVFLPDGTVAPPAGEAVPPGGDLVPLQLREVAGAAEPKSRTWRARYRVVGGGGALPLGSVVRVRFAAAGRQPPAAFAVPLAALDERGGGPRVWLVADGKVEASPVQLLSIDGETAHIAATLAPGARIVALGTHLLQPGMAVRELPR